jgi:hypothetical protein
VINKITHDIVARYNKTSFGRTECNSYGIPINCATFMTIIHNFHAPYGLQYVLQLSNCCDYEQTTQMCTYAAIIILSANSLTYENHRTRSAIRFPIHMIPSVEEYIEAYKLITREMMTHLVMISSQLVIIAMIYHTLSETSADNAYVKYPQVKEYISTLLQIINLFQKYMREIDLIYRLFRLTREERDVEAVFTAICQSIGLRVVVDVEQARG